MLTSVLTSIGLATALPAERATDLGLGGEAWQLGGGGAGYWVAGLGLGLWLGFWLAAAYGWVFGWLAGCGLISL